LRAHLEDRTERADVHAVYHQRRSAERVGDLSCCGLHYAEIADIYPDAKAFGADRLQQFQRLVRVIEIDDSDLCAGFSQRKRGLLTDALRAADHDGRLALQPAHVPASD